MRQAAAAVIALYEEQLGPLDACRSTYLAGAGGFSGARFWRVTSDRGDFCLRCWPSQFSDAEHLAFIHHSLHWARRAGFHRFPLPLPNNRGQTFVEHRSHLWELSRWLEGKADFNKQPGCRKLKNAAATLAEFHVALGSYPGNQVGPGYSLAMRRDVLLELRGGLADEIQRRLRPLDVPWRDDGLQLLRLFAEAAHDLARRLGELVQQSVELQPCIRDVWHDHVLFVGEEVSGIVDFGAMRLDDPATDAARLFGSLAGDDPRRWQTAWEAYRQVRDVQPGFVTRVGVLDRANVVLSGVQWLKWLHLEERQFEDTVAIHSRLRETRQRFEHLMHGEQRDSLLERRPEQ